MVSRGDAEKTSRRWSEREPEEGRPSLFKEAARRSRVTHGEPGWYEWTLKQFARYWYVLGLLALVLLVPLQIEQGLTPPGANLPPDPTVAGVAMIAGAVACLVAGAAGYWYLWKPDGWVDRSVARHAPASDPKAP